MPAAAPSRPAREWAELRPVPSSDLGGRGTGEAFPLYWRGRAEIQIRVS